ncbi:MAG: hypothetical protein LBM76_00760 [Mycoplasmataceae bacterium]|nr:hypothetical protein [Mycoplasmataceae bacterium]
MAKTDKTIKFNPDEETKSNSSNIKVPVTSSVDLSQINLNDDNEDYESLSVNELQYKLKFEDLSESQIKAIKKILQEKK